jgi:predicted Zn-dependent peptidase
VQKKRTKLADGVFLTCLPSRKFKTGLLSAQFVTPLSAATASMYALLPAVLRRGTVRFPDMSTLSAELDRLYGAEIDYTIRKKAENQCVGFVASFIDDTFAPGGEKLLEPIASLLGDLVCAPVTKNGRFLPEYVEGEKSNLIDAIRGLVNDKRDYADLRLLQELCAGEPYGISQYGDEKNVNKINLQKLYTSYTDLIASSRLEFIYSGSADPERVRSTLLETFSALPRENVKTLQPCTPHSPRQQVHTVTEELDVTQGKLEMGFAVQSDDFPALLLGNILFGGSSNSKLFLNVREKLSLCYYASSAYHRQKQLITVSSGIEFQNYQQAYDEIILQLKAVQNGKLESWELDGAHSTLRNAYASLEDSQAKLENFYLGQAATGQEESPEDMSAAVQDTSADRIFEAMQSATLDTVYFLRGKESAG